MMRCTSRVSRSRPLSTVSERSLRARSKSTRRGSAGRPPRLDLVHEKRRTARALGLGPVGARPIALGLDADHVVLERAESRDPGVQVVRVVRERRRVLVACESGERISFCWPGERVDGLCRDGPSQTLPWPTDLSRRTSILARCSSTASVPPELPVRTESEVSPMSSNTSRAEADWSMTREGEVARTASCCGRRGAP